MLQCKYRDIKAIYDWYDKYADQECKALYNTQPNVMEYAYYMPSQANWCYKLGYVKVGHNVYNVVTVFGQVKAVKLAQLPEYNTNFLRKA